MGVEFWTARDVQRFLGLKSEKTPLEWARKRKIPHYRIQNGKRKSLIRFSPKEIEAWLKKKKVASRI